MTSLRVTKREIPGFIEVAPDTFVDTARATLKQWQQASEIETDPWRSRAVGHYVELGKRYGINPHVGLLHALEVVARQGA
jgi:hypothetical protein